MSVILVVIGIFGGLVTLSNKYAEQVPIFGGTYREGIVGSPRFINPVLASSNPDNDLTALVYSGLVRIDAHGGLIPDLAQSWTISPDGKTYTVNLKPNATFQDGKPLTASDVVFTVSKIQDNNLKSPLSVAWNGVTTTNPDTHTVMFTLQKPYAGFLSELTLGILPEHIWSTIPDGSWTTSKYETEPIGSGPFQVVGVSRSSIGAPQKITLTAFKNFTLGKPLMKNFVMNCFDNENDALHAFSTHHIDGIAALSSSDLVTLTNNHTTTIATPLPRVFGIFLNPSQNKILADQNVVKALNLAIDKTSLITTVFNGYAQAINGPLPTSIDTPADFSTKQALAEKILDADGWKLNPTTGLREKTIASGKTKTNTSLSFSLSTGNTPELEQAAQLIANQYQAIGVHVDVKIFETGTLNGQVIRTRDFQGLLFGELLTHDTDVYAFWHSSQKADPGLNITGYTDKIVDGILEQAIVQTDPAKRADLYQTLTEDLAKDAPVVFLYTPDFLYLTDNHVHNVTIPPMSVTSDRFSLVYQWYLQTDRVWKMFTQTH